MNPLSIPNITGSEASGPPSPTSGPIPNFGVIIPGFYRSSFPGKDNIEHLQSLNLKTLVTLVDTPFKSEVSQWITSSGIEHHRIEINAHKEKDDRIAMKDIAKVMTLLNDKTKRPLLMHCNKGKHRTGCMVAAFCKLQGTEEERVIADYLEFAQPKARELDIAFIQKLKVERCKGVVKLFCYDGQCSGLGRDNASIDLDGLIDEDGSIGDREQGPVNIRQVAMGPEAPLSPPPTTACKGGCGFTVQELVDAYCKNLGRRSQDELSPPETP